MTTMGEALWHLMGSNVDDLDEATGGAFDRDTPLALIQASREALDILQYLIAYEDQSCWYDHHGYCQEHPGGGRTTDDGAECMVAAARRIVRKADGE